MSDDRPVRRRLLPLLGAAIILAGFFGIAAYLSSGDDTGVLLPDLTAVPPGAPALAVKEWPEGSGSERMVMRFDGVISNVGSGPLHVEGDPRGSQVAATAIAQVLFDADGQAVERLVLSTGGEGSAVRFENTDGHGHWHLMRVAEYALFAEGEDEVVVASDKIGFCLADVEPVEGMEGPPEPPGIYASSNQCEAGEPDAPNLSMGISPGWSDVYSFALALQWIDVTDVAPGVYRLAGRADPEDFLEESDEVNPWVFRQELVVVPGLVGEPAAIAVDGRTEFALAFATYEGTVDLTADNTGDVDADLVIPTGPPRFRIVEGPFNGTLDVGIGDFFDDAALTYTPHDGFTGIDTFTFEVVDPGFADPRPARAVRVTLNVGG